MNSLSNFDKTDSEYLLARTDDLVRFCRSEVTVTTGCQGGEGIHVLFFFCFLFTVFLTKSVLEQINSDQMSMLVEVHHLVY